MEIMESKATHSTFTTTDDRVDACTMMVPIIDDHTIIVDSVVQALVNVLAQMAKYDFNTPINAEIIFEENDDEDTGFQNEQSKQKNVMDSNNNKEVSEEQCASNKKSTNSENQINHEILNQPMLSLKPVEEMIEDIVKKQLSKSKNTELGENTNDVAHNHNQNILSDKHAKIMDNDDTVGNKESVPGSRKINDHKNSVKSIEELLTNLSENLVIIMHAFNHYGVKKANHDVQESEKQFYFIKNHFFELSYTTVESIFLPQEHNKTFINQFLDNTVFIANNKCFKWKCQKCHLLPFFNDLMTWAKQKREYIRNNTRPSSSIENAMLKLLARPIGPLDLPQAETISTQPFQPLEPSQPPEPEAQNNICIFASTNSGNEISINIDTNALIHITEKEKCGTTAQNDKNNAPSCKPVRRKTPAARPKKGNRVQDIQKKKPQYHQLPPPLNLYHNYNSITNRPQQYIHTNANNYDQINVNQTHYNNMGQPHQRHQNMGHPIPSYPPQIHYVNNHQISPNDHINNLLFNNRTDHNKHMQGMQMENQVNCSPITTTMSSSDPKTLRCCMCGRNTSRPCDPLRPIYCSYLCQELDSQFYKRTWANT